MSDKVAITARQFFVDDGVREVFERNDIGVVSSRFGGDTPDSNVTEEELVELVGDAAGIVRGLAPIGESVMSRAKALRVISVRGVGTDGIDLDAAAARGIAVTITPGAIDRAVAECAIALMFGLARQVVTHHNDVQSGVWKPRLATELSGKVLGVVGLGRIGSEVARIGSCLGMKVLATSRSAVDERARSVGALPVGLDELLAESDFVSLHCALTDDTRGLVGERELAMMKPGAYLINTARGDVVDARALRRALDDGTIGGAGLDVLAHEPPDPRDPLLSAPNVVVMPHTGGYTRDGLARANRQAAVNVVRVLAGEQLAAGLAVGPARRRGG